jgi:hypothetical protein
LGLGIDDFDACPGNDGAGVVGYSSDKYSRAGGLGKSNRDGQKQAKN